MSGSKHANPKRRRLLVGLVLIGMTSTACLLGITGALEPNNPGLFGAGYARALHGRTVDEVTAELGPPDTEWEFGMDQCCGEAEIELLNTYPESLPNRDRIRIRYLAWSYLRYSLDVWAHRVDGEWRVLSTATTGRFGPAS